ncbi:MAG: sterol desaturase family protein [Methyloceanibacter sp.]
MGEKVAYYADFVLFPLAVAIAVFIDRKAMGLQWISIAVLGWLTFTYAEYWVHRVVLHRYLWHGKHERHHRHPQEYVVFPIWTLPTGFFGLYAISTWLTGSAAFFSGVALGYVWFICWHHVLHHLDLTRWPRPVRSYAAWHDKHHDGLACNYGITVPWWDRLHGTSR